MDSLLDGYEKRLELQVPAALQLSPDGTKVVYHTELPQGNRKGDNATSAIWLAEVGKEASSRQLTSGIYEDKNPKWASDGQSILFTSDRKEAGKKTGLYQLSLSGGEPVLLTDPDAVKPISSFIVSPNGKLVAIVRSDEKTAERKAKDDAKDDPNVWGEDWPYNRLHVLHLSTRHLETVVSGDFHVAGCVWNKDSTKLAFLQEATPEIESSMWQTMQLKVVTVATKRVHSIGDFPDWPDASILQWVGDKIYTTCGVSPEGLDASRIIGSVALEDGKFKHEFAGKTYDANGLKSAAGTLVALVNNDLADELRLVSSADTLWSEISNIVSYDVLAPDADSDKLVIALTKSKINEPAEVFTLTTDAKSPIKVSSHGATFSDPVVSTVPVHCRSDDGQVELDGLFYFPKSLASSEDPERPSRPLKTLVFPHGGPYYRYTDSFLHGFGWDQTLLRSGIAVLLPNYRGGASHGKAFAGPYTTGTVDHDDVITMTAHAIASGLADPDNLLIGGWSQGGFLAYLSAVRNGSHGRGWRFRAAVAGAGVTDWDSMAFGGDLARFEALLGGRAPWDVMAKTDVTGRTGGVIYEFAGAAKERRVPPVLILHGERDERVPVAQAWAFQRACRRWGVECEMVTYPREGHGFKERTHLLDMQRRVLEFCEGQFK